MEREELRAIVSANTSPTLMANAFRRALGLPIIAAAATVRRHARRGKRTDYGKLMRQRYGALDRCR